MQKRINVAYLLLINSYYICTIHYYIFMRALTLLVTALFVIFAHAASLSAEKGDLAPKLPVYVGLGYNLVTGNPLSKSVD